MKCPLLETEAQFCSWLMLIHRLSPAPLFSLHLTPRVLHHVLASDCSFPRPLLQRKCSLIFLWQLTSSAKPSQRVHLLTSETIAQGPCTMRYSRKPLEIPSVRASSKTSLYGAILSAKENMGIPGLVVLTVPTDHKGSLF